MISVHDLYVVLSAVVPLYVAMILAYGSVRWWKFLTPEQCSGINRFVALFAVPLLSFHFIASNNPYHMNTKYIVADVAQKLVVLLVLSIWVWLTRTGSLEWLITIFMLATLPNTLVMGIPLLQSMYGGRTDILMVQFVVLQSIVWYTILLFLYEYRAAKLLVVQQFPDTAARIVAFNVDSDVLSIDGRDAIETEAEEREDGKIVVKVRRSVSSRSDAINYTPRSTPRRSSAGMRSLRPSNLSGMDIYSLHSSVNLTPRESNFTHADFFSMLAGPGKMASPRPSNFTSSDVYSLQSSRGPTPRSSNFNEDASKEANFGHLKTPLHSSPRFPLLPNSLLGRGHTAGAAAAVAPFDSPPLLPPAGSAAATSATTGFKPPAAPLPPSGAADCGPVSSSLALVDTAGAQQISRKIVRSPEEDARELHMFLWSGAASPGSDFSPHQLPDQQGRQQDVQEPKEVHLLVMPSAEPSAAAGPDFSFGTRADLFVEDGHRLETGESKHESATGTPATAKNLDTDKPVVLPAASVMFKLIATMACKKLARNPNTYATTLGVVWSLVAFKYHFSLPAIIDNSVTILSDAGLGMAMFSLGLFMALQKRFVVCGPQLAAFSMVVRFLTGPAVMAAASIAVGLRGRELHIAVVQAALPVGIVPFVFAKEYNVHADILSTALIFGIFVALPVTISYYVVMGT